MNLINSPAETNNLRFEDLPSDMYLGSFQLFISWTRQTWATP